MPMSDLHCVTCGVCVAVGVGPPPQNRNLCLSCLRKSLDDTIGAQFTPAQWWAIERTIQRHIAERE